MPAHQLLDRLKSLGIIDATILEKIETRMMSSKKEVSPNAVARYLIEKKQITKSQARELLKSVEEPKADEISVNVPRDDVGDTNDLLLDPATVRELQQKPGLDRSMEVELDKSMEVEVEEFSDLTGNPADRHATLVDMGEQVQSVDEMMEVVPHEVESIDQYGQVDHGYDPLSEPYDPGTDSGAMAAVSGQADAPAKGFVGKKDKSDQWQTKWLFIGFGLLGFLLLSSGALYWLIFRESAEQLYEKADAEFDKTRWSGAIEGYEKFLKSYPADAKSDVARAEKSNAVMRSFFDQKNWTETLNTAKNILPTLVENEEGYRDVREDFATMLCTTATNLAAEAKNAETLEEKISLVELSAEMMELIDNPSYVAPSTRKLQYIERILDDQKKLVDDVNFEIRREAAHTDTLEKMKVLTDQGKTGDAAKEYHDVTRRFPRLKSSQALNDAIKEISKRESELVAVETIELPTTNVDAVPNANSVLLATGTANGKIGALGGVTIPYLLDGTVYAVHGSDGQILWSRDVGFETQFDPIWIDPGNQTDLLLCDQKRNEILRVHGTDGKLVWKTNIGEAFTRPVIKDFFVFTTTRRGKVIRLNLDTGASEIAAQLPQGVTVGPVASDDFPFIYQIGQHSNLYALSEENLTCKEVYFVDHDVDTIDIEPIFLAGHLCIAQNFPNHCKVHVLGFEERGLKMDKVQEPIKVTTGKVTVPAIRYGRWAILISETGEIKMVELVVQKNDDEQIEVKLNDVIAGQYNRTDGYSNYVLAQAGNLWVGNRGLTRFRIQKSKQQFTIGKTSNLSDAFLGPMSLFDETLISLRRRYKASLATVSAMDFSSHEEVWRTDFGASLAGKPVVIDDKLYGLSGQGDLFEITAEGVQAGYIGLPAVRATSTDQNLLFNHVEVLADGKVVLVGPSTNKSILCYDPKRGLSDNSLSTLVTPADKPSCRPVGLGNYLLIPSVEGQIVRIDPTSGGMVGSPFQPPLDPNEDLKWQRPVVLSDGQSFAAADAKGIIYKVEANAELALLKAAELDYGSPFESPLARIGETVFAVCAGKDGSRLVAFTFGNEITELKSANLDTDYESNFAAAGNLLVMRLASNQLVAFDTDLNKVWDYSVDNDKVAGDIEFDGQNVLVAFESGKVVVLNSADGSELNSVDVGRPLASSPALFDGKLYISGQTGVVHIVELTQ